MLREVMEEYGCKGEIQEQLPAHSSLREWDGEKIHWVAIPFIVKVNPDEVRNNEPEKIDEISWFGLDNLPSPLHPAVQAEMERYKERFRKYLK